MSHLVDRAHLGSRVATAAHRGYTIAQRRGSRVGDRGGDGSNWRVRRTETLVGRKFPRMTLTSSARHGIIPSSTTSPTRILRMSGQQRLAKSASLRLVALAPLGKPQLVSLPRAYSSAQHPSDRNRNRNRKFICRSSAVAWDFHDQLPLSDTPTPTLFTTGAAVSTSTLPSSSLLTASPDLASPYSSASYSSRSFSTNCRLRPALANLPSSASLTTTATTVPRRHFSRTYPAMVAQKLDGNAIAKTIRERLATEIAEKQKINPRYTPCLKIIQGML